MKSVVSFLPCLTVLVFAGCPYSGRQSNDSYELYQQVQLGASRAHVERRLGKPLVEIESTAYYLKPPAIATSESPQAPGSIELSYSNDDVVVAKKYFGARSD